MLIDNNCTDNTVEIAQAAWASSNTKIVFRIISETQAGLSNARNAGFVNSHYEFALMVDDDNWLCEDYVVKSYLTLKNNLNVGMTGGLGIAQLECTKPAWFEEFNYCFATGSQSENGLSSNVRVLYGAGLCLRLSALDNIRTLGFESLLTDRIGTSLMSGGDTELCFAFRFAGWDLYYNNQISFRHLLPANRVNWKYLLRLFDGFGRTKPILDIYESALNNAPIPRQTKLPFWLDRVIYLSLTFASDIPLIMKSWFCSMEGEKRLLLAKGKWGQISHIFTIRNDYIELYRRIYLLQSSLRNDTF